MTGRFIRKITAHQSKVNTLALNLAENLLASGSFDNSVKIWDMMSQQHKPVQVLDDFKDSVTKVMFTDDQIIAR